MITKITGEQPFQVLTNNFSISPSSEGYTLQISADGTNFSNLFTVGAGVTRLVTGVAANSYYRLSGNQSKVSINWMKTCVTEGGAAGNELTPVTEFPLNADPGTVVALASGDTYGIYQYDGENWNEAGADVDLSAYWTSAETQSAITVVEDHLFDFEEVTSSALTELHEGLLEVSGRTISTEEIELPIAAAVNDLKENIETRLNQQYYTRQEVQDLLKGVMTAPQTAEQTENYVTPIVEAIYTTIEEKEFVISAALNDLNAKKVQSESVKTIWSGTQAEYDALTNSGATADANTQYIII